MPLSLLQELYATNSKRAKKGGNMDRIVEDTAIDNHKMHRSVSFNVTSQRQLLPTSPTSDEFSPIVVGNCELRLLWCKRLILESFPVLVLACNSMLETFLFISNVLLRNPCSVVCSPCIRTNRADVYQQVAVCNHMLGLVPLGKALWLFEHVHLVKHTTNAFSIFRFPLVQMTSSASSH